MSARDPCAGYDEAGGWVFVMSACCGCGNVFSYNPQLRVTNGLEPIHVLPGAYEALPASEL